MDIEATGSFFLVFSLVKAGFRRTFIESHPFGWCKEKAQTIFFSGSS